MATATRSPCLGLRVERRHYSGILGAARVVYVMHVMHVMHVAFRLRGGPTRSLNGRQSPQDERPRQRNRQWSIAFFIRLDQARVVARGLPHATGVGQTLVARL